MKKMLGMSLMLLGVLALVGCSASITHVDPKSAVDAVWGIPSLPESFSWELEPLNESNKSLRSLHVFKSSIDHPVSMVGRVYFADTTREIDEDVPGFDAWDKYLHQQGWRTEATDDSGRRLTVGFELYNYVKIYNGHVRCIKTGFSVRGCPFNDDPRIKCYEPYSSQARIFVSDPILLTNISN